MAELEKQGYERKATTGATLKRTLAEFKEDNLGDYAAGLTYYAVLAIFPALIAMVSVVGLFGDPATVTKTLTDIVKQVAPEGATAVQGPIEQVTANRGGAGIGLIIGILLALSSASSYVGAFMRASNVIYETPEGRPFWKLRPLQMLITLAMVILVALLALGLLLTGPLVEAVAGSIGVSDAAVTVWEIAKWPVMLAVVVLIVAVLYYASPNVKLRGFKWVTPGGMVAIIAWLIASAAFAFYVANFGSYDKTYGTLGGVVVMLMWLWITNLAILFGHELNAERERSHELAEGVPRADREIQLEPRDEPKDQKTT
jgi:membrane protein